MSLAEELKFTLDKTMQIAVGLEQVNSMIHPNKRTGPLARQRIQSISKELRILSKRANFSRKAEQRREIEEKSSKPRRNSVIIKDSPTSKGTKILIKQINEINEKVKLSKAGKKQIGKLLNDEALQHPMLRNEEDFKHYFLNMRKSFRNRFIEEMPEENSLPFVSVRDGKVEDPVYLPTFEEYLKHTGADYMTRTTNDELFDRITKAQVSLENFKKEINSYKFKDYIKERSKKPTCRVRKSELGSKSSRESLKKLYIHPTSYVPRTSSTRSFDNYIDAKYSLQDSLRDFYRAKAFQNKKLTDILDKMTFNRPISLETKTSLIEDDNEKFRNKLYSIEKFNSFRNVFENKLRERQDLNYAQGLAYIEIFENFKSRKYEPNENELLLLEMWRELIQSGWVVEFKEFEMMKSVFNSEELESPALRTLISAIQDNLIDVLSYCS